MLSRLAPAFPELCLQKNKGVWQPSPEALKAIFQQKRFTALDGTSEAMGDLKVRFRPAPLCVPCSAHALLLHSSSLRNRAWCCTTCASPMLRARFRCRWAQKSAPWTTARTRRRARCVPNEPEPLTVRSVVRGAENGATLFLPQAFSTIILPNSESTAPSTLQADDVSLGARQPVPQTYGPRSKPSFTHAPPPARSLRVLEEVPRGAAARRLRCTPTSAHAPPRSQYTAENLSEKGIHEVSQRRFVLVSAECARLLQTLSYRDHPTHRSPPRSQPPDRLGGTLRPPPLLERRPPPLLHICNWVASNIPLGMLSKHAPRTLQAPVLQCIPIRTGPH